MVLRDYNAAFLYHRWFSFILDWAVDNQIWALITSQCKVSDSQATVKACRPLVLYYANNVFLICDYTNLTFDHRPWNKIGIFLSSCWSTVPNCMILELIVQSVSCHVFLLYVKTTLNFDLRPFKTIGPFSHHLNQLYEVV